MEYNAHDSVLGNLKKTSLGVFILVCIGKIIKSNHKICLKHTSCVRTIVFLF